MAFLTLGATEVWVDTRGATEPEVIRVGESTRAFAGNLRSTVRAVKRNWRFTGAPMSESAFAALRATFEAGDFVTCFGDALGGTYECEVRVTDAGYVEDGTGFLRVPVFTLAEV